MLESRGGAATAASPDCLFIYFRGALPVAMATDLAFPASPRLCRRFQMFLGLQQSVPTAAHTRASPKDPPHSGSIHPHRSLSFFALLASASNVACPERANQHLPQFGVSPVFFQPAPTVKCQPLWVKTRPPHHPHTSHFAFPHFSPVNPPTPPFGLICSSSPNTQTRTLYFYCCCCFWGFGNRFSKLTLGSGITPGGPGYRFMESWESTWIWHALPCCMLNAQDHLSKPSLYSSASVLSQLLLVAFVENPAVLDPLLWGGF